MWRSNSSDDACPNVAPRSTPSAPTAAEGNARAMEAERISSARGSILDRIGSTLLGDLSAETRQPQKRPAAPEDDTTSSFGRVAPKMRAMAGREVVDRASSFPPYPRSDDSDDSPSSDALLLKDLKVGARDLAADADKSRRLPSLPAKKAKRVSGADELSSTRAPPAGAARNEGGNEPPRSEGARTRQQDQDPADESSRMEELRTISSSPRGGARRGSFMDGLLEERRASLRQASAIAASSMVAAMREATPPRHTPSSPGADTSDDNSPAQNRRSSHDGEHDSPVLHQNISEMLENEEESDSSAADAAATTTAKTTRNQGLGSSFMNRLREEEEATVSAAGLAANETSQHHLGGDDFTSPLAGEPGVVVTSGLLVREARRQQRRSWSGILPRTIRGGGGFGGDDGAGPAQKRRYSHELHDSVILEDMEEILRRFEDERRDEDDDDGNANRGLVDLGPQRQVRRARRRGSRRISYEVHDTAVLEDLMALVDAEEEDGSVAARESNEPVVRRRSRQLMSQRSEDVANAEELLEFLIEEDARANETRAFAGPTAHQSSARGSSRSTRSSASEDVSVSAVHHQGDNSNDYIGGIPR